MARASVAVPERRDRHGAGSADQRRAADVADEDAAGEAGPARADAQEVGLACLREVVQATADRGRGDRRSARHRRRPRCARLRAAPMRLLGLGGAVGAARTARPASTRGRGRGRASHPPPRAAVPARRRPDRSARRRLRRSRAGTSLPLSLRRLKTTCDHVRGCDRCASRIAGSAVSQAAPEERRHEDPLRGHEDHAEQQPADADHERRADAEDRLSSSRCRASCSR